MNTSETTGTNTQNVTTSNVTTTNVSKNNNAPKNNAPKNNNAPTNNAPTNNALPSDKTVESLQREIDERTSSLQEKINSGDCDAINKELKQVVKIGNSIMTLINAGRSKESDFTDTKGKLQVATENIKVKCPPKNNQTGGKHKRKTRKTRKQNHKRKSRRV